MLSMTHISYLFRKVSCFIFKLITTTHWSLLNWTYTPHLRFKHAVLGTHLSCLSRKVSFLLRKKCFYLTMHSAHFILRLYGIRHKVIHSRFKHAWAHTSAICLGKWILYFQVYIHLRFKLAVLGINISYLGYLSRKVSSLFSSVYPLKVQACCPGQTL